MNELLQIELNRIIQAWLHRENVQAVEYILAKTHLTNGKPYNATYMDAILYTVQINGITQHDHSENLHTYPWLNKLFRYLGLEKFEYVPDLDVLKDTSKDYYIQEQNSRFEQQDQLLKDDPEVVHNLIERYRKQHDYLMLNDLDYPNPFNKAGELYYII